MSTYKVKLVELNRIEAVEGGLNPRGQVLGVGALALLVLSGIAFVFRANPKFATLEARLSEAALREQQIQIKNEALKVEVAERRRAEAALLDSEREFRAIANYTYDWEDWTDPDDRLLWVNPAVERVSGYSVDDYRSIGYCRIGPRLPEAAASSQMSQVARCSRRCRGHNRNIPPSRRDFMTLRVFTSTVSCAHCIATRGTTTRPTKISLLP